MSFYLVYSLLLLQFDFGYAPCEHKSPGLYVLPVIEENYKKRFDDILWPPGVNVRDYNPRKIYIMAKLSVIPYNCKGFNVSKGPYIKILLNRCSVLLLQ